MQMGQFFRAFFAVGIIGGAFVALAEAKSGWAPDPQTGRALLTENCASCHAVDATGTSPVPEAVAFHEISARYPVKALEEALAEGIMVGHDGVQQMPEFRFNAIQIGDIIAYLESIQDE
ncbi:MAG: monocytochrome c [Saliniramus fredricksonii]|uniref:Cytochrome C oxidase, cbb3-type, subunit III n=1 Tax=Saliniramus fredricksonii TaxID=1653334 RepID=A0A0P8BKZ1_9HYPH|nr:cytochrome c [Saliniramus fredricksonii]KPQ10248.1 MAG: monocytochrome c [Saliniramus fredricksonii]SCC80984.1 Cytochrome C oxidase, cbb3-type, subunit III [Saliniramus fredricksonii]